MSPLAIWLLGEFRVVRDEHPVAAFESDRVRALLAYLAVEAGRAHDRNTLAGLLWPNRSEPVARTNLRHVLHNLRRAIGDERASPPFLRITSQTIQWNSASGAWIDAAAFAGLVAGCRAHAHASIEACAECMERLKQAVTLYRGNFLAGVTVSDSVAFEEWARVTQERLHRQVLEALYQLAGYHEARREYNEAIQLARRQVEIESWREEAHRQLMRLLALAGRRSEALTQYTACRRILADELSVEPEPETIELYERIRTGRLQSPPMPDTLPPPIVAAKRLARPTHNLPPEFNAFIGRSDERADIHARLDQAYCRLVTLVGPGGAGKSRLAIAAARERLSRYADGVWFVPLAGVNETSAESVTNTIATAMADPIGLSLSSAAEPLAQLRDYLRDKHTLLVLDDFEHLTAGVDLIRDILDDAPHVQLLVTSRQLLNLQSEWLIEVTGLPFPADELVQAARAEAQSAVALFEERRRQVQPRPIDTSEERASIRRICRLVEGMPLAIELAVSATRAASCLTVAATITRNLGELVTTQRDVPPRQRSLKAVFDTSWQQLTREEQALLAQLSIFRGGFTAEAAARVAQATPSMLKTLQDKSFLHQPYHERFTLHEVLRFFAAAKLSELAGADPSLALTADRHTAYYLSRVRNRASTLGGADSQRAVQDILSDLDNVRQAWQWALDRPDFAAIRDSQSALILFYRLSGLLHEGAAVLAHAIGRLRTLIENTARPSAEAEIVLSRLYIEQCHILRRLGAYAPALEAAHVAIQLAQDAGDAAGEADARYVAGLVLWYQGDFASARREAEAALQHHRRMNDRLGESRDRNLLGLIMEQTGDYTAAQSQYETALALSRSIGDRIGVALELSNLGSVAGETGDYGRQRAYYLEALPIARQSSEPRLYGETLSGLGCNSYLLGDYAHALECYEQSLAMMRSAGDRAWESRVLLRMSRLFQRVNELARARDHCRQALTIARSIGHRGYESAALAQMGYLYTADQNWDEAAACYREALALRQVLGQPQYMPELQASLAWIAVQQGQADQAKAEMECVLRYLEANPTLAGTTEPIRVLLVGYHVLTALASEQAGEVLRRAYDLLQQQSARIASEMLRHSFLDNVPAHQAIVAAWAARA